MHKLLSQPDGIRYLSTQNKGSLSRTSNIQKDPFQYTHNGFRYALALTHLGGVEISKKYLIVAMNSLPIMSQLF
jgi:hypothetical protein